LFMFCRKERPDSKIGKAGGSSPPLATKLQSQVAYNVGIFCMCIFRRKERPDRIIGKAGGSSPPLATKLQSQVAYNVGIFCMWMFCRKERPDSIIGKAGGSSPPLATKTHRPSLFSMLVALISGSIARKANYLYCCERGIDEVFFY